MCLFIKQPIIYFYSIYWPLKDAIHFKIHNETTIPHFSFQKPMVFLVLLEVTAPNL